MVSVDEAVIARLKSHGEKFEILVDPRIVNEDIPLEEALAAEFVFSDAGTGDRASHESLTKVFNTTNVLEIARTIIKKGEIQLTTEQRKAMLEEKRRKIVQLIARNAVDPRTRSPHPPHRIENAMEQARIHIDLMSSAEEQVTGIIKELRPLLPLRVETKRVAVKIPAAHTGKYYQVKEFGKVMREEWQKDGSYIAVLEIPGGMEEEFYERINAITKGEAETKLL
ncbi:MAG: ribosome assembly factor SBDS [Theionarchaea archaeon]|nr:ribosome assembly factor SBDS [Theionarchaea archaeon]MBU7037648.1 ribosome assembly factor SBDS [Theionarchaea archaeon]